MTMTALSDVTETMSAISHGGFVAEDPHVDVRIVVAQAPGTFAKADDAPATGAPLSAGQIIGAVGGTQVPTPFNGVVAGWIAEPGERLRAFQPILWLRAR